VTLEANIGTPDGLVLPEETSIGRLEFSEFEVEAFGFGAKFAEGF